MLKHLNSSPKYNPKTFASLPPIANSMITVNPGRGWVAIQHVKSRPKITVIVRPTRDYPSSCIKFIVSFSGSLEIVFRQLITGRVHPENHVLASHVVGYNHPEHGYCIAYLTSQRYGLGYRREASTMRVRSEVGSSLCS